MKGRESGGEEEQGEGEKADAIPPIDDGEHEQSGGNKKKGAADVDLRQGLWP